MDQVALDKDFPTIMGEYFLSRYWSINLPVPFNRRVEEDSLVLWNNSLSILMTQFEVQDDKSQKEMVLSLIIDRCDEVTSYKEFEISNTFVAQCFLKENNEGNDVYVYHYTVASEDSILSIKTYATNEITSKMSKQICQTIKQS